MKLAPDIKSLMLQNRELKKQVKRMLKKIDDLEKKNKKLLFLIKLSNQ